jgi:hypothetical protein
MEQVDWVDIDSSAASTGTVAAITNTENTMMVTPMQRALMYIITYLSFAYTFYHIKYTMPLEWIFVLILIIVIVVAFIYARRNMIESIPTVIERPLTGSGSAELDAFFEKNIPLSEPPQDYLNARFWYRYKDCFVYKEAESSHKIFKVYPLCCDTCKINAKTEFQKQLILNGKVPGIALITQVSRYPEPPRHQGQAKDAISYVVFHTERVERFPKLSSLTCQDIKDLMTTALEVPKLSKKKIKDMSIANVGRLHSTGRLGLQHFDDTSPVGPNEMDSTTEYANFNLFYNRYNVLKHIPEESFTDAATYQAYKKMMAAVFESNNHYRDFKQFMKILESHIS